MFFEVGQGLERRTGPWVPSSAVKEKIEVMVVDRGGSPLPGGWIVSKVSG